MAIIANAEKYVSLLVGVMSSYTRIPPHVCVQGLGWLQLVTIMLVFSVQDLSTMIRYRLNPIILLINNGGYTIEVFSSECGKQMFLACGECQRNSMK